MSVLGRPQHDWDDFLEEAAKPRRKWPFFRILLVAVAIVVAVVIVVFYYKEYSG